MFDPIKASQAIKDSYIDYITTAFDIADQEYAKKLRSALQKEGAVAKGPYLDIGGSYETGRTLLELVASGQASQRFLALEPVPEKERELKLERPLYTHQETALLKAAKRKNLVVTTGTGSGKTESFLLPIIDHLLREEEQGTLDAGVRAIIIYPMNALANDQIKRMRALFKNYPKISFGLYNGSTPHQQSEALREYRRTHVSAQGGPLDPLVNEIVSREKMQETPPHILITNYSMLEYMMLRPKDGAVFNGAQLRFIVLDEAHIYKGATGMETSLLMRRLRARISDPNAVQYILTSATLGGPDANESIVAFANKLCGVSFDQDDIIRSKEKQPQMLASLDFPPHMFEELQAAAEPVADILARYKADFAPNADNGKKIYELCLRSKLFGAMRKAATVPITVSELHGALSRVTDITSEQVVSFISVCARAEKNNVNLIKPRYHFFVRALEGAYITLRDPKELYLQRKTDVFGEGGNKKAAAFEAAVCTDCGRVAIVGKEDSGYLKQFARKFAFDDTDYYLLKKSSDGELIEDTDDLDEEAVNDDGMNSYLVCPVCAAVCTEADAKFEKPCEHDPSNYVKVYKIQKTKSGTARCPACGFGSFRRFYLGSEAATAVLGTELFEQLPSEEVVVQFESKPSPRKSIFAKAASKKTITQEKTRQFLCFSDSRSEAAFFASYMERSYQEFLRRRGIWHVAEKLKEEGYETVSVAAFIRELARYFEDHRSFAEWDKSPSQDVDVLSGISKENAWVAILNEMFNARRGTSLTAMGVISFEYTKNDLAVQGFQEAYGLENGDARALLELLVQDAVYSGAIDAGKSLALSPAEREYIFFTPVAKKLVKLKGAEQSQKNWLTGWQGRKRSNGNYYTNSRILRLTRALGISEDEADGLLQAYWDDVFNPETVEFTLDANDFRIHLGGTSKAKFYRCKKCGKITPYNTKGFCASVKCDGQLTPYDPLKNISKNHYARLYQSEQAKPLYIKEHTAQLAKDQQTVYQEAFVNKKINALSCSTTFEMGVDVGSLETVYMRDVPPSPSNYVQRAGRAGRSKNSAAYVLTYAKLSSHDFTYYQNPTEMISGKISAPVFEIENEKIIYRHIFAIAISSFLARNNDVYAGDNQTVLLNENGYERLKEYLDSKPQDLKVLIEKSIPQQMHSRLGIDNWSWTDKLYGENGVLEIAVQDFRNTVNEMKKARDACHRMHDDEGAGAWSRSLRNYRCSAEDNCGKKSLISFLVRNNVLPKYGFPVDTVELIPDISSVGKDKSLQLARDLQMAIADYAPGAEVVADGKMYVSRYIRKTPGKNTDISWEKGFYCPKCATCGQPNFTKEPISPLGRECVSCHTIIKKNQWLKTLEPRRGFLAEKTVREVPLQRPEHDFKTDDYYIGDPLRNVIKALKFSVNDQIVQIESTSNDSLVVIGQTSYKVCPVCGYANETVIPPNHKNANGYPCVNKEGKSNEYRLAHDFKTDVARITFNTAEAADLDTMLSVLYALLEGLSREMGIERTDIKGCLFRTTVNGCLVYSVILYDAVAGGAGHVRRIVTDDGKAFQKVLQKALAVVSLCDCDSSCYKCLRNYYNQKIHDNLSRKRADEFLRKWIGQMIPIEE